MDGASLCSHVGGGEGRTASLLLHPLPYLFAPFLTSLLLSSPSGCVAYGMGCVVVSLAPPSQPGPMAMAAPPSPLLSPFLLRAPCSDCVAYGMAMTAPPSVAFLSLLLLDVMLYSSMNHIVP